VSGRTDTGSTDTGSTDTGSTDTDRLAPAALVATRRAVHGLAEYVLAAHQRRLTRSIKLAVTPTGLRTARMPEGLELALRGAALVREADARRGQLRGLTGRRGERPALRLRGPAPAAVRPL
jgi:hypothetical protein